MGKYEKIYQKLRKTLTDEEIADSMLIPPDLTAEEKNKADAELRALRFKLLNEMTEEQRIYADLLRLRYQIESYLKEDYFDSAKSFGKQLSEYVRILNRTKKKVSEDLNIHYTRFSRILNDREDPNIEFIYRLEKHSGELIPALIWWKLITKKQEFEIKQDKKTRKKEGLNVKDAVKFRA